MTEQEKALAALVSLSEISKKIRRNIRLTIWAGLVVIITFITIFVFGIVTALQGKTVEWSVFTALVSLFGAYQGVRLIKDGYTKGVALMIYEKSVREAYEKLTK